VFHSNLGPILYHFRDVSSEILVELRIFPNPRLSNAPITEGVSLELGNGGWALERRDRQAEKKFDSLAVSIKSTSVTDGRTDGKTQTGYQYLAYA